MKKKMTGYGLLVLLFVWSIFQLPLSPRRAIDKNYSDAASSDTIVAPAIIDSLSDITRIPTLQSGVIKQINVSVGDKVKKGDILFSLDNAFVENNFNVQRIKVAEAKNELLMQRKHVKHIEKQLDRLRSIDKRAISRADLLEKRYEVTLEKAKLMQAEQNLALAEANLKNAELTLNQFNVVAPKDGVVLQINGHIDEFVGATQPIVFLGDAKKIIVRVSLDERDIQQFHANATAYLTSNDNIHLKIPLTFMQLQRYIVTQERLNSRVQEVLYTFNREDYPTIVAGQQFDATIAVRTDA
jgi:membrane fusion protein, macrolide-specific efflux system